MKKLFLLLITLFSFSFYGMCDVVHVRNTTGTTVYVHVYFNDGMDCAIDDDIVICIPPFEGVTIDLPGRPFSVQVNTGCPIPDWGTSSWRHNDLLSPGCTDAPIFSETPYAIEWVYDGGGSGVDWGIIISI